MPWEKAASLADLENKPALFKRSPKQIAVFKVNSDVYAIDNRCPHEGYPLTEGTVDDNCQLTCNWHNWKFRLTDGECVIGGDDVRSYPVKVKDGAVWVDISDPPPEEMQARILKGLRVAFNQRDFERICREITRLKYNGLDPLIAVRRAIEWSHNKLEFGTTHAFAAAADWLALANDLDGDWEKQLVCLAETVDHMAFDALRHQTYEIPAAGEPFDRQAFVEAVEAEDHERAEAMIQRGLDDGLHWPDMEQAFAEGAALHYNDFGHSLIYAYKMRQLIDLIGKDSEQFISLALARSLCYATREDLIPEFKGYAPALVQLTELSPGNDDGKQPDSPFPSSIKKALEWVVTNFADFGPLALYDSLLAAIARNLLHYDMSYQFAYDRPVTDNVGWLDFTHGVTFANAARVICEKYPSLWPQCLLQIACFLGRNRSYLDLDLDESEWIVDDRNSFFATIQDKILDHGFRDPIFSAHVIKTPKAVEEELAHTSPSCQKYLLASLNRFLNSPLKQKHVRRLAHQAIALVKRDFA